MFAKNKLVSIMAIMVLAMALLVPGLVVPAQALAISVSTSTLTATDVAADGATMNARLRTDTEITVVEYGFYYDDSSSVTDVDTKVVAGNRNIGNNAEFYAAVDGLDSGTAYWYKSYVIYEYNNQQQTALASYARSFTTERGTSIGGVEVLTEAATYIGDNTATLNATLDYLAADYTVTEYGFYYGTVRADVEGANSTYKRAGYTGLDENESFDVDLTSLSAGKTYYFMAYVEFEDDANDADVAYGNVKYFTTDSASSGGNVEVSTDEAESIGDDYATLNGTLETLDNDFTVTEYGFYYGTVRADVEDADSTYKRAGYTGLDEGDTFDAKVSNLDTNKTYYFMAYVEYEDDSNNTDTAYGNIDSFKTVGQSADVPEVTTDAATEIDSNSAVLNGELDSFGDDNEVTEYGFYYGTSSSPGTKIKVGDDSDNLDEGDNFDVKLTGFKNATKYYFKAYARNSSGIGYGTVRSFTTGGSASKPSVTTNTATLGSVFVTLNGTLTDDGNSKVDSYGFYYGLTSTPGTKVEVGSSLNEGASFSYKLTNLVAGTKYYVQAYAANNAGTSYGSVQSFTMGTSSASSVFTIDSTYYSLRGSNQWMDVAPYIKSSRTYMPIRYVGYAMGLTDSQIIWIAPYRMVILTNGSNTVVLNIGSRTMYSNGQAIKMDVAPEIRQDRTCLPISWVASAFGKSALWDAAARTVTIR